MNARSARATATLLLSLLLVLPAASLAQRRGGGHQSGGSRSYSSRSSGSVHVRSYTRKDGTVVRSHTRSRPGSGSTTVRRSYSRAPRIRSYSVPTQRDSRGGVKRSSSAKQEFMRQTRYPHGRPGYVVDHIKPLACGGADSPSNMQWQTQAEAKAKDRTEKSCR